jgi:hypothetical protein
MTIALFSLRWCAARSAGWVALLALYTIMCAPVRAADLPQCSSDVDLSFQASPPYQECSSPVTAPVDPAKSVDVNGNWVDVTFAALAWQTFKVLVWPASKATRGEPDPSVKTFADVHAERPRVFETFKADWEMFLNGNAPPPPNDWNHFIVPRGLCKNNPRIRSNDLVLASRQLTANLRQAPDPDQFPPGDRISGFPVLRAQNGSFVYYLVGFNAVIYKTMQSMLANNNVPPRHLEEGYKVPDQANEPDGAISVKSAWITMKGIEHPDRFYMRDAWVQDPFSGKCDYVKVGLVGLHITHKTISRPQWIWASFEQIDKVDDSKIPDAGPVGQYPFTFSDGSPTLGEAQYSVGNPGNLPPMTNVVRDPNYPFAEATLVMNNAWTKALQGSVWQYYKLVTVQWPGTKLTPIATMNNMQPDPPCGIDHKTPNVANSVIETFVQYPGTCSNAAATAHYTCIGCHYHARGDDFIWSLATKRDRLPRYEPSNGRP